MNTHAHLHVEALGPVIGAVVHGVDLSKPMADGAIADIRAALLTHQVVFFEDQQLTPAQQRDFGARFGTLRIHPRLPKVADVPEIVILDNHAGNPTNNDVWHTDATVTETPPLGTILRAVELPPSGGDTMWSSMTAAYDALSPSFRDFLAGHEAAHDFMVVTRALAGGALRFVRENPPAVHPVIRTHPETGRQAIFVNSGFTTSINSLEPGESRAIMKFLHEHIQRPEFTVRWRWKPGSMAFWDNRCTQHFAVNNYLPHRRVMHQAVILGDKPFYRAAQGIRRDELHFPKA